MNRSPGSGAVVLFIVAVGMTSLPAQGHTPQDTPAPADKQPSRVTNPDWLVRPTIDDMMQFYPPAALRAGKNGRAVINCLVTTVGLLKDCTIVSETPRDMGFGVAAVGMSSIFKMRPMSFDGVVREGPVVVPINFDCACDGDKTIVPKGQTVYLKPNWTAAASVEQWKAAYPKEARARNLFGGAAVKCDVKADGSLGFCSVTNENHEGAGFGAAAKSLVKYFRTSQPKGSAVILTVHWAEAALSRTTAPGLPSLAAVSSPEKAQAAFPAAARNAGVMEGKVMMACDLDDAGALLNCAPRNETPQGLGFADAALALTKDYRFNLWTQDGVPVARRIVIPMSFGARLETAELSTLVKILDGVLKDGNRSAAVAVMDEIRRRFSSDPAAIRALNLAASRLETAAIR